MYACVYDVVNVNGYVNVDGDVYVDVDANDMVLLMWIGLCIYLLRLIVAGM